MSENTKIVHVAVVDGEPAMLKALGEHLTKMKKENNLDIEFLITNDKVQVRDVKYLLKELIALYKRKE